jgi:hypothetical protein
VKARKGSELGVVRDDKHGILPYDLIGLDFAKEYLDHMM